MRWSRALRPRPCVACRREIQAGEPYRLMTKSDWWYCADCATRSTGEPVPDLPWVVKPAPPTMRPFPRFQIAAKVRSAILDFRQKQAGGES